MYSSEIVKKSPWDKLNIARDKNRPNARFYIENIFNDFLELHGDRYYKDDSAIIGGIASINNINVTVIGINKGKDTLENIKNNFGMPHPEGYRKALRLMKQAEKFNRPVITFIDTKGAYPGIEAEERGQGEAIARSMLTLANLKTIVIAIVIGEGSSGGALAIGVGDKVIMLENAVYSILSPEGYASILWKEASKVKEAAEVMKLTANDLYKFKVIDKKIKEPEGGIKRENINEVSDELKSAILKYVKELKKLPIDELVEQRYQKFRNMGEYIKPEEGKNDIRK